MEKLEIGKKYKVRGDLELLTNYGRIAFVGNMAKHKGKFVTIESEEREGQYRIEEMCYIWTPEMFDLTEEYQERRSFKVGDEIENIATKHRYIVHSVLGDKIGLKGSSYNQNPVYEAKNFGLIKKHKEGGDFELDKRTAIHCKTKVQALRVMEETKVKWPSGCTNEEVVKRMFISYSNGICINVWGRPGYSPIDFYRDQGYKIIEANDFLNQKGETKMVNKTMLKVFGKEKLEDVELIKKHLTGGGEREAIRQELINEIVIEANKTELLSLALELEKKEKLERTNK